MLKILNWNYDINRQGSLLPGLERISCKEVFNWVASSMIRSKHLMMPLGPSGARNQDQELNGQLCESRWNLYFRCLPYLCPDINTYAWSNWLNRGDDRSVKIKSLEAAKIMKIKWLVLGCIEAIFCNSILVRKLLTRFIRFTCVLWQKRTEIENEIMIPLHLSNLYNSANFRHDFFSQFSTRSHFFLQFSRRFVLKLDQQFSELNR